MACVSWSTDLKCFPMSPIWANLGPLIIHCRASTRTASDAPTAGGRGLRPNCGAGVVGIEDATT